MSQRKTEPTLDNKRGKFLEAKLNKYGKQLVKELPCFFHRFTDTHDAGNFVGPTPGDFMLMTSKGRFLLECKESIVLESLTEDLNGFLVGTQTAFARLWERAGGQAYYLFLDRRAEMVELWQAKVINDAWIERKKISPNQREKHFLLSNLKTALIQNFFE